MEKDNSLKAALVRSSNVVNSVFFRRLADTYVDVSNYPRTTVEISRGEAEIGGRTVELVATPGFNGLLSVSEDERTTLHLLFFEKPDLVIQVADARPIRDAFNKVTPLLDGLEVPLRASVLILAKDEQFLEKGPRTYL